MEDGMKPLYAIFSEKDEEKKVTLVKFLIFKNFLRVILPIDTKCDSSGYYFFILARFEEESRRRRIPKILPCLGETSEIK